MPVWKRGSLGTGHSPISANLRQDSFAVARQPIPAEIGGPRTGTAGFPQSDFWPEPVPLSPPSDEIKGGAVAFSFSKGRQGRHEFTNQVQHRTKVLPWKEDGMSS